MAAPEREARVARVVEHDPETRSLVLRVAAGERLAFVPGQFISCLLPIGGEQLIRPYSLASDPEDEELEIVLNLVPGGRGSAYLLDLRPGATLRFTGPWGTFTLDRAPAAEAVFVADGTGIAPIRPMLHRALRTPPTHPLRLLHATERPDRRLWADELAALVRAHPRFSVEHVASADLRSEVTQRFVDADADRSRRFWICGVGAIVPALRDLLRGAGYERRAVQYEKW
jgi:ferredoxin-NADP reductase